MVPSPELRGRLLGLLALAAVLTGITAICTWFWVNHSTPLLEIAKDPFSLSFVLALLVLLYFLLITARAANEPQYSMFLFGRVQEIIFLRQWGILIAPLLVLASLGIGYYKEPWQVPLSIVGWPAALYAVYSTIKDITGAWLRPIKRERYFLLETARPESGEMLPNDAAIKPLEGYRVLEPAWRGRALCVPATTDLEVLNGFLISPKVNLELQNSESALSQRKLRSRANTYKLPEALLEYRETALIHTRAKGGLLHNENKIRLCVDPAKLLQPADTSPIEIQKTSYYLGVCSNELTRFEIFGRDAPTKIGNDMFNLVRRKANGAVIDLGSSELSNHMGGGTLAITPSGKMLLSKQGRLNVISPGLLVPSGSGSFDWRDQHVAAANFSTLIKTGLERELMEECGFSSKDIARTIVLGMGRDLARGGKPEFFGVTLLARNEEIVQPTINMAEVGFVDHHDEIELVLAKPTDLEEQLNTWINLNRERCSVTLIVNLRLLISASQQVHAAIYSHING